MSAESMAYLPIAFQYFDCSQDYAVRGDVTEMQIIEDVEGFVSSG